MERSDLICFICSCRPKDRHVRTKEELGFVCFLGGGRQEGEMLQGGSALFSPLGRNQGYFYFTL